MQIADLEQKRLQNDLVASQIFNNGLMSEKITQDTNKTVANTNESLFKARNLELDNQVNQFEFGKQKNCDKYLLMDRFNLLKKLCFKIKAEIKMLTLDERNQQILPRVLFTS